MYRITYQQRFKYQAFHVLFKVFLSLTFSIVIVSNVNAKEMIGWVENVQIFPGNIIVKAKIDTGADTSSINSEFSRLYKRDGKQWIKFSVTDIHGKTFWIDKKIIRKVRVKKHYGELQRRPLIRMGLCINNHYKETYVSLIDRSEFNYNLLIGRNFLQGHFIVDPSLTFMAKPHCLKVGKK